MTAGQRLTEAREGPGGEFGAIVAAAALGGAGIHHHNQLRQAGLGMGRGGGGHGRQREGAAPGELLVAEQVEKLIKQATNTENLCQHYIGWCSFW